MASYNPKLLNQKYNNWVKGQLAVLFTKEGLEPFVCNEIQQFQLKCLDDICYNNGIFSGTICSSCSTENVVKCPTKGICIVGGGQCSFHRNSKYILAGCPNRICHNFKLGIQKAHRHPCPSYKNTDTTQWCSNSWEVAKCFMPPDGYKDKASATETDFNGIISVILNYKDFQRKVHENLKDETNVFEVARKIGRHLRHSSTLEVEDTDLQEYFQVLQQLLSDSAYLASDTHAQNAKQKLTELENDTLVIGKDDRKKAIDDVVKALQDKIKAGLDEQTDRNKLDAINILNEECNRKRKNLSEYEEELRKRLKTAYKDGKDEEYMNNRKSE
ncbi:uncharacterized protein LOC132743365 [Ruditapes philippinarum]|uniref:uncharacterized protein LOC132743365 n=1 Tax=Ruditapes philippinarum TaxID=129788 RepID=UPI00295A81D4|nr:uncharacterized protein LOC132743365 [Ruditapes philippinarum]